LFSIVPYLFVISPFFTCYVVLVVYVFDAALLVEWKPERAMVRISANIAAFALIALSIGFNMWRYPAVWDMVGGSPCLSLASESAQPEATAEPSAAPTVVLQAADVSEDYERYEFDDRRDPCEVAPSAGYASVAEQDVAFTPEASIVGLVPVVRSDGDFNFGDALRAELGRQIVRLPPIDREASTSASRSVVQFPTYRIYPTTGL
jgi:hypothetical protein